MSYYSNGLWLDSDDGPVTAISVEDDPTTWLFLRLSAKWIGQSALQLQMSRNPVLYQRAVISASVMLDGEPATGITVTQNGSSFILGNVLSPESGQPERELSCTVRVQNVELGADISATYTEILEPKPALPPEPWSISAQLIQQSDFQHPDIVQLSWTAETAVRLTAVIAVGAFDPVTGVQPTKESFLCFADSTEDTVFVENCRRFLPSNGALHDVRFHAQGYRLGVVSSGRASSDAVRIRANSPAGYGDTGAERWDDSSVLRFLDVSIGVEYADIPSALRDVLVSLSVECLLVNIKQVLALGGQVTLADFGVFKAVWSKEVNDGVTFKAAERGIRFKASKGFLAGVRSGLVLTDAEVIGDMDGVDTSPPVEISS